MAAANPFIMIIEKVTGVVVSGLTTDTLFSGTPDRTMYNTSNAVDWSIADPKLLNPTLMDGDPLYLITTIDPINGGNENGSFIEVEIFYKKVKRFDKKYNGTQ